MNNNYERPVAFVILESAMSGTDGMAVEKGLSLFRGQESMEQFLLQSILIILLIR